MSTGLLNGLMNAQSQTATPAGQQMQVVMIPSRNIIPNPDNDEIYTIGNMDGLKDDIQQHGLRQPLEVIPVEDDPDRYMLISGHRRWAACGILSACGESRFDTLPCLIRESHGKLDDRIALITANATARDLTDGERLAQYEALKDALAKKKAAGQLEGKVRNEVCRILGLSTGAAARLNVIASCENEVIKERLKAGEIGLMEAYRSAQDYARFMGAAPEEPEQKEEPAETVPVNPDYAEWKLPPEAIAMVEKTHEKKRKAQTDALQPVVSKSTPLPSVYNGQRCDYSASHRCENEAGLKHFIKHGEIHDCAGCCSYCKKKDTCEYSCAYASKGKETQEPAERAVPWTGHAAQAGRKNAGGKCCVGTWRGKMCVSGLRITSNLCPAGATLWKPDRQHQRGRRPDLLTTTPSSCQDNNFFHLRLDKFLLRHYGYSDEFILS